MDLALLALEGAEISAFLEQVVVRTREILEADFCDVFELTGEGRRLVLRSSSGWDDQLVGEVTTIGTGLDSQAGYTLILGEPVHVDEVRTGVSFAVSPLLHEHGAVSGMTTAIRARGAVYGLLGVHSASRRRFTDEDARFLQDVAGAIGGALEHAFSRETARRSLAEECRKRRIAEQNRTFLSEVSAALAATHGTASALRTAARMAVPTLADWCFVDLIEDRAADGPLVVRAAVAGTLEEPVEAGDPADGLRDSYPLDLTAPHGVPKVTRTGEPELLPDMGDEALEIVARGEEQLAALRGVESRSYLCVPLRAGRSLVGAIGLVSTDPRRRFGPEHVGLAADFASLATLSIDPLPGGTVVAKDRTLAHAGRHGGEVVTFQVHQEAPKLLTPRQLEVLRLVAQGLPNKEIAGRLHVSQNTVDTHAKRIRGALGATSRLEAVQKARDLGLLTP